MTEHVTLAVTRRLTNQIESKFCYFESSISIRDILNAEAEAAAGRIRRLAAGAADAVEERRNIVPSVLSDSYCAAYPGRLLQLNVANDRAVIESPERSDRHVTRAMNLRFYDATICAPLIANDGNCFFHIIPPDVEQFSLRTRLETRCALVIAFK